MSLASSSGKPNISWSALLLFLGGRGRQEILFSCKRLLSLLEAMPHELERKPFCISISIGSSLWLRSRSGVLATTPSQGRYYLFPLGRRRLRKLLKRLDIQAVRITGQCLTNMAVLRQTSEEGQNARETFSKIPIWFRSGLNRAFFFANSENSPREANSPASFDTGMAKRYSKQGLPTGCRENTTVTP